MFDFKAEIKNTQDLIDRAEKAIAIPVLTNQPYIVMCDSMHMNPEIVDGKTVEGNVDTGFPWKVRRFSKENAQIVADLMKNGNGVRGHVIGWNKATRDFIISMNEVIQMYHDMEDAVLAQAESHAGA